MAKAKKKRRPAQVYLIIDSQQNVLHSAKGRKRAGDWGLKNVPNNVFWMVIPAE